MEETRGHRLDIKLLDCFDTQTVLVVYMMHNGGNHNTIIKEAGSFSRRPEILNKKRPTRESFLMDSWKFQ